MPRKPVEIDPECGRRLKSLMVKNKFTQPQLAERVNCGVQHISNIARGVRRLTPDLAQRIIDEAFPSINVEWLLNRSEFETIAEKERYSQKTIEAKHKAELIHDKAFRIFIDGMEDLCGYELHSQEADLINVDYITVSDATGEKIGAISAESFDRLKREIENFASYSLNLLIKTEMQPLPNSMIGGADNG